MEPMDDNDLPGELDITCVWCGGTVYDVNAEVINGRRFCKEPCAAEYVADVATAEETECE